MGGEVVTILSTIALVLLGLVSFGVRAFITGKVVPRSTLEDKTRDFDEQIKRERQISEEWRQAALQNNPSLQKLSTQIDKLLVSQETVEAVINAIPRREIEGSPGGRR